jgi:hypothetical protein
MDPNFELIGKHCRPSLNEVLMREYQKLAKFLNNLPTDPNARVSYDVFADALIWSDEVPPQDFPDRLSFSAADLRGIWRYRTTLILGRPEEKRRDAWDEAMKCFPNWPGFDLTRRDVALAATFAAMQQEAMNKWEYAEDCINTELARNNVNV